MNKSEMIMSAVVITTASAATFFYKRSAEATYLHLCERAAPNHLDRKVAMKVHRQMVSEALRQKGDIVTAYSNDDYDDIFMKKYIAAINK